MGETADEVRGAIADLRNVGVDVLTLGQYLRPSAQHLPVARWWTPEEFAALGAYAERLGFGHVESGPSSAPATTPSEPGLPRSRSGARCPRAASRDAAERLRRAREMRELGVDVLLLSTGADLRTSPATRPCRSSASPCSWSRPGDTEAMLVVPRLEAPARRRTPGRFTLRPWDETDDPIAVVADLRAAGEHRRDR